MTVLSLLSVVAAGALAGALLTEAFILVPYWRTMEPSQFLGLHSSLAPRLFGFYAPLTVLGTALPILRGGLAFPLATTADSLWCASAFCACGLLLVYFAFFRGANASFAKGTDPAAARALLETWARVHQMRTLVAIVGFVLAASALGSPP